MKSAAEAYHSSHTEHSQPGNHTQSRSSRIHYVLVAVLLVVAYLVASLLSAAPGTVSFDIGAGFVFFWLVGGLTTLGLLALAAKH